MTAIGSLSFVVHGLDILGRVRVLAQNQMRLAPPWKPNRGPMRDVREHKMETERTQARTLVDFACGYRNLVQNGRPSHQWKQACELRWDALD